MQLELVPIKNGHSIRSRNEFIDEIRSITEEKRNRLLHHLKLVRNHIYAMEQILKGSSLEGHPLIIPNKFGRNGHPTLWIQLYDLQRVISGDLNE